MLKTPDSAPVCTTATASPVAVLQVQNLDESQLRDLALSLLERIEQDSKKYQNLIQSKDCEIKYHKAQIDALTHEIRVLRHLRFAAKNEAVHAAQKQLFEEANAEDIAAAEQKLAQLSASTATATPKQQPKRQTLPAALPRVEVKHEPANTTCDCGQPMKRISEDVSERLDYVPGTFRVERHVRGVWACACCECVRQQAMPAQIINGGIPTSALLAQVVVSKYLDHLPLFRQSKIYERAGVDLSLSTLADWVGACGVALAPLVQALKAQLLQARLLHADESPLTILGSKGETKRGYIWAYASGAYEPLKAVVFEVHSGRSGQFARDFLRHEPTRSPGTDPPPGKSWSGFLLVDDYAGYKALFTQEHDASDSIVELGCWAHVRRKFHELHIAAKSTLAQSALEQMGALYAVESEMREQGLALPVVLERRQRESLPRLKAFGEWLRASRTQVPDGSATAKAIDYALKRWPALVRYCEDATLPMDNNRIENLIRPWALGRKNWLFSGSLAAAQRAAGIASLLQSAKLNGHEPMAYLTDVLNRLPTHPNSRIAELLPTTWQPEQSQ